MFSPSSEQQQQGLAKQRLKEPSSSSSLVRSDTIKAGYFDGGEGAAEKEKERGAAKASAGASSSALGSSSGAPILSPAESAARLAALSAELERLQKNQAVLEDALARGRAVLVVAPSSAAAPARRRNGDDDVDVDGDDGHRRPHSTLTGALADPPLVDLSPGAQAAHKKKFQRREAKARGGESSRRFVSGGLCGFEVAEDLLKFDFDGGDNTSSSAEFRAAAFDEPQTRQKLRSLRSQAAELLPAGDPKLAKFLKELELQQRIILKMLSEGGIVGGKAEKGGTVGGDSSSSSSLIPASLVLSPLLKNPLARLAAAGMTVPDDEGTAEMDR